MHPLWKPVWSFLKKNLKLKLLYDPVIPLLAIYLEKRKGLNWKDICIPMFIAALFTLAKTWKQPKCWSADDWFKRMWYMDFPGGSAGKEFTWNAGNLGLILGLERSVEEGKSYPLQYSGLENSTDCIVHGSQRAKTWKQPKCRPADGWFKKMWYIHTMEYYSAIKINETLPSVATWMNLENIILSKISQTEEDIMYHLYVESKKLYKWIYIQNKHRLTDIENKSTQRGRGGWIN